jgi:hypothetical protein
MRVDGTPWKIQSVIGDVTFQKRLKKCSSSEHDEKLETWMLKLFKQAISCTTAEFSANLWSYNSIWGVSKQQLKNLQRIAEEFPKELTAIHLFMSSDIEWCRLECKNREQFMKLYKKLLFTTHGHSTPRFLSKNSDRVQVSWLSSIDLHFFRINKRKKGCQTDALACSEQIIIPLQHMKSEQFLGIDDLPPPSAIR